MPQVEMWYCWMATCSTFRPSLAAAVAMERLKSPVFTVQRRLVGFLWDGGRRSSSLGRSQWRRRKECTTEKTVLSKRSGCMWRVQYSEQKVRVQLVNISGCILYVQHCEWKVRVHTWVWEWSGYSVVYSKGQGACWRWTEICANLEMCIKKNIFSI